MTDRLYDVASVRTALHAAIDDACDQLEASLSTVPRRDFIDDFNHGIAIGVSDAARFMGLSQATIRDLCKDARAAGEPISWAFGGTKVELLSWPRLLEWCARPTATARVRAAAKHVTANITAVTNRADKSPYKPANYLKS